MLVLGLSFSHDASACLLEDGKIVVAIQQERLSRIKHDTQKTMTNLSMIQYCLEARGVTIDEIDLIVSNVQSLSYGGVGLNTPLSKDFNIFDPFSNKHIFISHHLAHAFSAFSPSGQKESVVMVIDAAGSTHPNGDDYIMSGSEMKAFLEGEEPLEPLKTEAESYYYFQEDSYELLDRYYLPSHNSDLIYTAGIGMAYAVVSNYIFNDPLECGKVMGLAPYGDPTFYSDFNIMEVKNDELQFNNNWQQRFFTPGFDMDKKHLAAKIQYDLENALMFRAQNAINKAKTDNICYAGGVALNCVANGRVLSQLANELFIQPASNDAGVALGCAYYGYSKLIGKNSHEKQTNDYRGKEYSSIEIREAIEENNLISEKQTDDLIEEVARRLKSGEIIAWFQGGSEFGPRSLGHRSILANPLLPNMKDVLNTRVKHRESFRPFAPICPEEDATIYFDVHRSSPFMLLSHQVKQEWQCKLPSITHVDFSTRLQTLDMATNPMLHALLKKFGNLTGVPVLINTSFNLMGEPIVETPQDAINCFLSTDMDALILGNHLLVRQYNKKGLFETHLPVFLPSVSLISELKSNIRIYGISNGINLASLNEQEFLLAEKILLLNEVEDFISIQNEDTLEVFEDLCKRLEKGNFLRWQNKYQPHLL